MRNIHPVLRSSVVYIPKKYCLLGNVLNWLSIGYYYSLGIV